MNYKSILLVDDEEMIKDLSKQIFSRLAIDVEVSKDGTETSELYK